MKKALSSFKHYIRSINYSKIIDTLIILCGFGLIAVGTYFIYNFSSEEINVDNLEPIAKVEQVYLSPKRKIDGALVWGSINNGQTLYRGDQVVTDDLSKVDIKFDDNSSLNIPPNSLVKIDYNKNGIHLELIKGLVSLDLKNMKSKIFLKKDGKSYQLDGANGNVEVRKSGDKLEFSSDKGNVKVLEIANGKSRAINIKKKIVKFTYPEGRRTLNPIADKDVLISVVGVEPKKEYVIVVKNKKTKQQNQLSLKGAVLTAGYRFPFFSTGLHTVSLAEKKGKSLQAMKTTNFEVSPYPRIVFTKLSQQENRTVMTGDLVSYEWSPIGQESYVIEVKNKENKYQRVLNKTNFTINPKESSLVEYRVRINRPNTPWTRWVKQFVTLDIAFNRNEKLTKDVIFLDSPERFLILEEKPPVPVVFELARDNKFKKVTYRRLESGDRTLIPKDLRPGSYYWRVRENKEKFRTSKVYPIRLTAYAVKYLDNQKTNFISSKKTNHKVKIYWKERIKKASYRLGIRKKGEKKPFKVITANQESIRFTLPTLGQYEVLLVPKNHKDILVANKPLSISVMLPELKVSLKTKDIILKRSNKLGLTKHYMKLPRIDKKMHKKLLVSIYKDKAGKQRVYNTSTTKPYLIWKTRRSGLYYYRLRVEDKWGRVSNYTAPKNLLFPISPFYVTALRIPAGRKRYYKFPYVTKRGDDLATILRNFTKPSTVLSNKSPMVQKIMQNNKHVKNWNRIKGGKKITVYVNADVLDKTFLYVYKKLFIVKN